MKVIAFASDKGGMGKSTAAVNLACAAVEDGFEVAILDLDPQASVGRWARVRKKKGLPPKPLAETCVAIDIKDRLEELRASGADLVILDTAGRDSNAIAEAIDSANLVITTCHPSDLEISTLAPTLARPMKTKHFVLLVDWTAGAARRRVDAIGSVNKAGGVVAPVAYTHRSDYRVAIENGKGVTEYQPFEPAANEIRSVWSWLHAELSMTRDNAEAQAAVA
jgi:chromosome partitioning protein